MRLSNRIYVFAYLIGFAALLGLFLGSYSRLLPATFQTWKFVRSLEAKVDPILLKQWSEQLIKAHPIEEEAYHDWHGTNLPPGLEGVWFWHPWVSIAGETNAPTVVILWAHGPILVIGGDKPQDSREGWREWKPGIRVGWTLE